MDIRLVLHILSGLLLLLIPAGALYYLERKMLRALLVAVVRMALQLLVVSLMVWALIKVGHALLLILWLAVIVVYAAWIVLRRCKLETGRLLVAVSGGMFVGVLFVGLWILALAFPVRVFDARWFVPVMALLTGHATAMLIRGMNTYVTALKADEPQYEFLRGNGASHLKALEPFLRRALLAVISPTIANLSVLALTSMPLLFCGILLGGMTPINAFVLMLQMVIGCTTVSVLTLLMALLFSDRVLFDRMGKLK